MGNEAAAPASRLIDTRIAELGDWRGETLAQVRSLIRAADSDIVEEWKWNVPVWSRAGIICTGESYRNAVKLTFAKGAALDDPAGLFNASLEGKVRRAIDLREGEAIQGEALQRLVRAAVALNESSQAKARNRRLEDRATGLAQAPPVTPLTYRGGQRLGRRPRRTPARASG